MTLFKAWLERKNIPKELLLLLTISGLYALGLALSNTFVNIFLWKHTKSFTDIGLYNLMIVIFQPITFMVAGKWAKTVDRIVVLRAGVAILALFFISVLIFGAHTQRYLLLFGALIGIGYGCYWCAYNVLVFEVTEPDTRDFFNGIQGVLGSVGGMIGPIMAGWIISSMKNYMGYRVIFAISLTLLSLAVLTSFFLKRRASEGAFIFRRIIQERANDKNWKDLLWAHFFQGLREGTFAFIIGLWVFLTTKSELSLGEFALVESGVSFISYFVISRLIKPHIRKTSILIGGIILYGVVYLLIFNLTYTTLIVYAVIVAIAYPLLFIPYGSLTYDVIGHGWKAAEMRIEYIVVKELFLNGGRILSILLFLGTIWYFKNDEQGIRYLMMVIGTGHLAIYFWIRHIVLNEEHKRVPPLKKNEGESPI